MNRVLESPSADAHVATSDQIPAPREPELLDTSAICDRLGIHRNTWHRWVATGQAPAPLPNIPGHPRWSVEAFERFKRGLHRAQGRVFFGAARRAG